MERFRCYVVHGQSLNFVRGIFEQKKRGYMQKCPLKTKLLFDSAVDKSGLRISSSRYLLCENLQYPLKHLSAPIGSNYCSRVYSSQNLSTKPETAQINDCDVFGTLSDEFLANEECIDEEEAIEDCVSVHTPVKRHPAIWFHREVKRLQREGKIKEAIELIEKQMLEVERIRPTKSVFTALISALASVGYTRKAFNVFNRMKERGLTPTPATYTALFNACSESPFKEDGMRRARKLRYLMNLKGHAPNFITYKAVVKAFGKLGDLRTAFLVMDEMREAGHRPDVECYNMLLIACVSDKEAGLKHAIEVVRQMRRTKQRSDIYTYNLLARAVRQCGLGSPDFAQQLLLNVNPRRALHARQLREAAASVAASGGSDGPTHLATHSAGSGRNEPRGLESGAVEWWQDEDVAVTVDRLRLNTPTNAENVLLDVKSVQSDVPATSATNDNSSSVPSSDLTRVPRTGRVPDILDPFARFGNISSLEKLDTPEARMGLFGGVVGFLSSMEAAGVRPDLRTFTQLLDTAPDTACGEEELLALMRREGVCPDVDFYSLLIKRRCFRGELAAAREVFSIIQNSKKLKPTPMTFGCLATGCRTQQDASQLLDDMAVACLAPNVQVFGALVSNACYAAQSRHLAPEGLRFLTRMLVLMRDMSVRPNTAIIERVERCAATVRRHLLILEKNINLSRKQETGLKDLSRSFKTFQLYYAQWLESMDINVPEHPWAKFGYKEKNSAKLEPST